jgi:hypothetical protein
MKGPIQGHANAPPTRGFFGVPSFLSFGFLLCFGLADCGKAERGSQSGETSNQGLGDGQVTYSGTAALLHGARRDRESGGGHG